MIKAQLVREIKVITGLELVDIIEVLDAYVKVVKDTVIKGDEVVISNFGKFHPSFREKKKCRNICLGVSIMVAEHYKPAFKAAPEFIKEVKDNLK